MNIFIILSKVFRNDAHTCCKFFQITQTRAPIFTLFIVLCLKICLILHQFITKTTFLTFFHCFVTQNIKITTLKNYGVKFSNFKSFYMTSGVQELRHNFRSKLLKFRSGWQLCNMFNRYKNNISKLVLLFF